MANDLFVRAGKAAVWVGAARWFDMVGAILTLLITARLLAPEDFGIYGMALLATLIPETVLGGALSESLIQRRDLRPGHLNGVFALHMVLFVLFMAGLWVATPLVVANFNEPLLGTIVPILSASLLFGCLGAVPGALLQRDLRFGVIAMADAAATFVAAVMGIGLALIGWGVWSLLWMEVSRRLAKALVLTIGARWMPTFKMEHADISDLMRFNLVTLATRVVAQFESAIPKYFVGLMLGAQALGYLNMAFRFYQQISTVVLAPFSAVALPVASAVQHDREQLHATMSGGTKIATLVAFPLFIGAAAVAPVAIPLVLGESWAPVVLAAQILLLTAIRSPVNAFNGEILRGTGKPGLQLGIISAGAVFSLALAPLVTPYGVAWASAAVFIRGMLQWVIAAFIVEKAVGYPAIRQFLIGWESMVASLIMAAAVLGLHHVLPAGLSGFARLSVLIVVGAIVHFAALAVLAPALARRLMEFAKALIRRDRRRIGELIGM